ncbi:hypothetical protein [Magnetospira sp. QH-2]|nr:hypothetical protein [Magnetospira sp. QH-2]
MSKHSDYRVLKGGRILVRDGRGGERRATDSEWIHLWLRDPRITMAAV